MVCQTQRSMLISAISNVQKLNQSRIRLRLFSSSVSRYNELDDVFGPQKSGLLQDSQADNYEFGRNNHPTLKHLDRKNDRGTHGKFEESVVPDDESYPDYDPAARNEVARSLGRRPEFARLYTKNENVLLRISEGWRSPEQYADAFRSKFSANSTYQKIWSNNLGTLDLTKLKSPVDFAMAKPEQLKRDMNEYKRKFGKTFTTEKDYVAANKEIEAKVCPRVFEKGDVVILSSSVGSLGDKAIVVSTVRDENYLKAIKIGNTSITNAKDGYIVVKIRHPLTDPLYIYDKTVDMKSGDRWKGFGARVEIESGETLVHTGYRVDFDFLHNKDLFDHFKDPIERPFIEENILIPELKERFLSRKDLFLWVGVGNSAHIRAERS